MCVFSLNSNVLIDIHEYVNETICISNHHKTNCVLVIIWHQVCCFRAISSRDMSNFVGKPPQFSSIFSLNSHGFINIHENYKIIICISDHFVTIRLGINLKASVVL